MKESKKQGKKRRLDSRIDIFTGLTQRSLPTKYYLANSALSILDNAIIEKEITWEKEDPSLVEEIKEIIQTIKKIESIETQKQKLNQQKSPRGEYRKFPKKLIDRLGFFLAKHPVQLNLSFLNMKDLCGKLPETKEDYEQIGNKFKEIKNVKDLIFIPSILEESHPEEIFSPYTNPQHASQLVGIGLFAYIQKLMRRDKNRLHFCKECNKTFLASRKDAKFCSKSCTEKSYMKTDNGRDNRRTNSRNTQKRNRPKKIEK